ncbi:response regulator of citrate/malate metabolism [Streptosporangium becharense]|uniref:Transcriptional regulatory protein n=1 Tax=Streptosporangium becharense TaxID=1816182 RepID=A0A7W9IC78_9ACTN|nr:response regulator [Streptosporangium becharense]MBB2913660.1 response regulator of citrate/malate metabolism [Streptosporangium becharense]MBB5817741.1 response regulator of citrate/malate metabolism [Streptosporangium becharense]
MISVLVVEDEEITAEANRLFVERVPGFRVVGVARSGGEALRFLRREPADLVLLDLYLPDMHGLDVCRALRAAGVMSDVIAVTSARDLSVVRSAVSVGVAQYLLKPFTFATLSEKLTRYAEFRSSVAGSGEASGQGEVDRALAALRGPARTPLPKGMTQATLDAVLTELRRAPGGLSAQTAGAAIGVSRVTARRYLEHLTEIGITSRIPQYGGVGRPELLYRIT